MSDPNVGNERRYPEDLRSREAKLVAARRARALGTATDPDAKELPRDALGLALSGGGIRSATFCLGFLQVLANRGILRRTDFLSTVSGGGYCGSFLGRWFARAAGPLLDAPAQGGAEAGDPRIGRLEEELNSNDSPPLRWLRESGRYMSPTGPGDVWLTLAVYLRNLVSVQLVVGVGLVAVLLAAWVLRGTAGRLADAAGWSSPALFHTAPGALMWWSPWMLFPVAFFAVAVVPLGWAYWLVPQSEAERGGKNRALHSALFVVVAAAGGSVWIFAAERAGSPLRGLAGALAGLALLALLALVVWFWTWGYEELRGTTPSIPEARNVLSTQLTTALAATALAFAAALVDSFGQTFYAVAACQGWSKTLLDPKTIPSVGGVIALFAGLRKIAPALDRAPGSTRFKLPLEITLAVAAILVAAVVLTGLSAATHALVWVGQAPTGDPGRALVARVEEPGAAPGAGASEAHRDHGVAGSRPFAVPLVAMLAAVWLSYSFGKTYRFLNLSSHHAMYAARLTRAYLGATNPHRRTDRWKSVREVHPADDVPFRAYRPHAAGGPLHLVNVTINETVAGDSQVEYRDRKGVPMAVGPVGVTVGARHHAVWVDPVDRATADTPTEDPAGPFRNGAPMLRAVEPPAATDPRTGQPAPRGFHPLRSDREELVPVEGRTLGEWIAISGAAFTTGLGYRTSLGASFLLGLSNIRLGYWWNSSIGATDRNTPGTQKAARSFGYRFSRLFPVQSSLASELLARFYGPARKHWYLSDGGHFENTACYELIRRRLPRIICCDCGADPDYLWSDVANLARKIRIDFNAEMTFVRPEQKELDDEAWIPERLRGRVGPARHIGRFLDPTPEVAPPPVHASIARVYYMDDPEQRKGFYGRRGPWGTTILFVKPSLTGNEPLDIREYAREHPAFPHESTLDQDFDEAQWESYRKLGEHVGGEVVAGFEDDPWWDGRTT